MTSLADELRQAAAHIREVAGKATPGPWENLDRGDRIISSSDDLGTFFEYVVDEPLVANPDNGDHIALWDPDVVELVAKMLDEAAHWATDLAAAPEVERVFEHELALVRAINAKAGGA